MPKSRNFPNDPVYERAGTVRRRPGASVFSRNDSYFAPLKKLQTRLVDVFLLWMRSPPMVFKQVSMLPLPPAFARDQLAPASRSSRGTLKAIRSSRVTTLSTSTSKRSRKAWMISRHQQLRRGCAGRDAQRGDALEFRPGDLGGLLHQQCLGAAGPLGHLDQAQRVGAVRCADHDQPVAARGDRLHRRLPVGGGIADVLLLRADDGWEALLEDGDHGGGVVDRKGGLGDIGEALGIARAKRRERRRPSRSGWRRRAAAGRACPPPPGGRRGRSGRSPGPCPGGREPRRAPWRPAGRWRPGRTCCGPGPARVRPAERHVPKKSQAPRFPESRPAPPQKWRLST